MRPYLMRLGCLPFVLIVGDLAYRVFLRGPLRKHLKVKETHHGPHQ